MNDVTLEWRRLSDSGGPSQVADPLAHVLKASGMKIVGIGGPPGAGKSTIARATAAKLRGVLVVSTDDFYLSKDERAARGMRWRGPPGSHDLDSLLEMLDRIKEGRTPITVRRFSAERDDRAEPDVLDEVPTFTILEGMLVGYGADGYEGILDRLDLFTYLDLDSRTAHDRRFAREAGLREHGGGFSEEEMQRFWDVVLGPGIDLWVRPAKDAADLVIELRGDRIGRVLTSSPVVASALLTHG